MMAVNVIVAEKDVEAAVVDDAVRVSGGDHEQTW